MQSEFCRSCKKVVAPPRPNEVPRPGTVEECHIRAWFSMDTALDMVADRVIATRRDTWEWEKDGARTRRTMGIASLGGATLDNEENYLIKKFFSAMGALQIENQARI